MINIIADDKIPFLKGALEPYASIRYMAGREIGNSDVKHADALLIRTRTRCNESLLHGSKVKFIATATIGFEHIDTDYCDTHAISWTNAPGCNAASVQQYIASVLATLAVKNGLTLRGKTLGIVGVGHVGKKVETLAGLLGMKVFLNDPPRSRNEGNKGFVPLEQLLEESDIITLHVPLNRNGEDKTVHLINRDTLGRCKTGAWLINSSRGEVVDGDALKSALSEGRLSGAVLDVWENEPLVDIQLLEKVTLATPHIAGYSADGKINGTVRVVRSLGVHFDLPVQSWKPSGPPEPSDPAIILDCRDQSLEMLACRAILHAYDVSEDNARFRSKPVDFEKQRGNYPFRREFPAYKIILLNGSDEARDMFRAFGFHIVENQ
jgi:erythronate-4-phosphate dehydrogenase